MSNNKKIVNISIRDKRAIGDGTKFVCDNSDYVLHFDFDKEWDGKDPKTARLVYGSKLIDIPFIGNEAEIERTPVSNRYSIGVYAGDIKTSTPAIFDCDYSILSTNPFHAPIPEDVYNQIMELIGKVDDAIIDVDALPTDDFKPNTFYRVKGKLYYRVGDKWAEIATDFFDYVKKGDFDKAVESLSGSIEKLTEADTATGKALKAHGEKISSLEKSDTEQNEKISALEEADKAKGAKIVALEEADTATGETLDNHGERIAKSEDDLIVVKNDIVLANAKVGQIYSVANNSLSTANIALTDVRTEESRAKDAEVALEGRIGEVESLAKGANKSLTYSNYATMIATLNSASREQYNVGQNILIVTLNVPDLWVSEVVNLPSVYTYTTDEAFADELKENGSVQVGYYKVSALETGKVDLTEYATKREVKAVDDKLVDYVKNTDYATSEKAGVVKVGLTQVEAFYTDAEGNLCLGNDSSNIDARSMECAIRNSDLDYAVKVGLTTNLLSLTEEEKKVACTWLGAVRPTDYPESDKAGVVKVSHGNTVAPLYRNNSGALKLGNYNYLIDDKTGENAVRNKDIDYAVMKALTEPINHTWTGEEQEAAHNTLGITPIRHGLEQLRIDFEAEQYRINDVAAQVGDLEPSVEYINSTLLPEMTDKITDLQNAKSKIAVGEWHSDFYFDAVSNVEVCMLEIEGYGVYEYFYAIRKNDGYAITGGGMIYCAEETQSDFINAGCRYSDDYIEVYDGTAGNFAKAYILVKAGDYSKYNITFKMRKIREI